MNGAEAKKLIYRASKIISNHVHLQLDRVVESKVQETRCKEEEGFGDTGELTNKTKAKVMSGLGNRN